MHPKEFPSILNMAHRGASGHCPENTLAAFSKGLELGATGIETDVQLTSDGRLVLVHDETLDRTTGRPGLVKDLTLEEIQSRDAGSWFHPDYKNEQIPVLEQLFELVKQTDTVLNIEIKNGIVPYPGIEERLVECIRSHQMSERVILSSFNHYSLVHCKQLAPEIRTAILYMEGLYEPWAYAQQIGAQALHPFKYAVTREWTAEAAQHGITYCPFTINEPGEMVHLINLGVAGMITDYPDRLAIILAERSKNS